MKKTLLSVLIISLLFTFVACDSPTNSSSKNGIGSCNHNWNEATCELPKTCSKCEETKGNALGHTTDSGICSRCGENFSNWKIGEYVDEFKEPTGEKYMGVDGVGTFSNSATSNSRLDAFLQIDKNNIGIMLYEYGYSTVKGTFDYEEYEITILDSNGTKHYFTGILYKSGTRVYFYDEDRHDIFSLLVNNDELKIYLKSTKYSISTYLFTIKTAGFYESYNKTF